MNLLRLIVAAILALDVFLPEASGEHVRLEKSRFIDKCRGAWAGQMLGVCYGFPYEFRSNGKPIEGEIRPWKAEMIGDALGQDDCYVEMTFLKALVEHGLDITFEQAGKAFAESQYPLWHANKCGRENIRRGIMPPLSGHPSYNRHADDIDFQIEADLFGIIAPGLPQESNRLCDIFGHIMNYGDGVYGGMFVAGMYSAAYLEDSDVRAVLEAGLACIPKESLYHQCISDTMRWHDENPEDWLSAWRKIEDKWQDDIDCIPGNPFNIDAKLNGAYIAMGLLYGNGDMMKTLEVSTRCGQDADCNPSNAAGVLGCMMGMEAMGPDLVGGIAEIEEDLFLHTVYSFKTLVRTCQKVAEELIERAGGKIEEDAYLIPEQKPVPPKELEQWEDQMAILSVTILPSEMEAWDSAWRVVACGHDMEPGVRSEELGRINVLALHPVNREEPAVIEADLTLATGAKEMVLNVASDKRGDFLLKVSLNGKVALEETIDSKGEWVTRTIDISDFAGEKVVARVENRANGWKFEAAYLDSIEIR